MTKLALACARLGECHRSVYGPMPACSGRCLRRRQRGILEVLDAAIPVSHSSERIIALVGRGHADALFRDALSGFVTEPPPPWAQAWAERIGDGSGADRLQGWVCSHLRRAWMTGIGAIEAAEQMIEESMSNGNLSDPAVLEEVEYP